MIRVLIAVCLTVAIVAVAVPAVEDLQQTRSVETVTKDVAALDGAAEALRVSDDQTTVSTPRRVHTISLPAEAMTTARVEQLRIEADRILIEHDGTTHLVLRPTHPYHLPDGPVVLEGPGDHDVWLTLETVNGTRMIQPSLTPPTNAS